MDENDKGKSTEICLLCPACFNLLKIDDFMVANREARSLGLQVKCGCGNDSLVKFKLWELHIKALALVEKVGQALKTAESPPEKEK